MTDLIKDLDEKIARLEDIKAHIVKEIESIKDIRDRATNQGPQRTQKTHFLRIAEFLLSKENKPRSASAILRYTGIPRNSLSQILHRTHKASFISTPIPGFSRKKRWSLTADAADDASKVLRSIQTDLFGNEVGDLGGLKAVDCCAKILTDNDNQPLSALTMAKEAIRRGYKGFKARGSEDEIVLTTAKSFWAALGRDERFTQVRPLVFQLRE